MERIVLLPVLHIDRLNIQVRGDTYGIITALGPYIIEEVTLGRGERQIP